MSIVAKLAGALSLNVALLMSYADASESPQEPIYLNGQLPWHPAVLDAQGEVLAWYHPEKNLGYDQFLRLDWDFLEHKVPIDTRTGVKVYLTASVLAKACRATIGSTIPASTFAHQMDALLGWYPYSGDAIPSRWCGRCSITSLRTARRPRTGIGPKFPSQLRAWATRNTDAALRACPGNFYGGTRDGQSR